jgi:hypothetical protein
VSGGQWLHVFLDVPPDRAEVSSRFWSAALGWPLGDPWPDHPEFRDFVPPDGDPYLHQQVGDHRPRVHLDLEVADQASAVDRLIGLGATVAGPRQSWTPLTSPGGFPFCVVTQREHVRPAPLSWPGGRSGLVQICLDSPADRHDREVAFWRSALDWRWADGDAREFAGKLYPPPGSTVHLLFQRLGADDPGTTVRAHIDLGTDQRAADAARLQALGAEHVREGRGWIALRDPAGMIFCTTGNPPDGGP